MELQKHITDEKTGISYTLQGDYYLPDLSLPEQEYYDLGRFARAKFRYLQNCHKAILATMRIKCSLNKYLHEVDVECEEAFATIVKQMAQAEGITEQLKADEQMLWVQKMNSIKNRAEEIIFAEYINVGGAKCLDGGRKLR